MKKQITSLALLFSIVMFQNCSETSFGQAEDLNASGSEVGLGGGSGGDSTHVDQPAANTCFQITCVSDANAANTLQAVTNSQGIIAKAAPSNGSTWVLKFTSAGLQEGHNCWSNEQVANGGRPSPDQQGVPLCQQYGPAVQLAAPLTFTGGFAKNFRLCEYAPCNSGRAQSQLVGNIYHWIMAKPITNGAHIEIRAASWGAVSPGEFTNDFNLPLSQCATVNYANSGGTIAYRVCNNSGLVTARFANQQFTLDLRGI